MDLLELINKREPIDLEKSFTWTRLKDMDKKAIVLSAYVGDDHDEDRHEQLKAVIRETDPHTTELLSVYALWDAEEVSIRAEKGFICSELDRDKTMELARDYDQPSIMVKDNRKLQMLSTQEEGKVLRRFELAGDTSRLRAAFTAYCNRFEDQPERKIQAFLERRKLDFPTAYVYQGADDRYDHEWLRLF